MCSWGDSGLAPGAPHCLPCVSVLPGELLGGCLGLFLCLPVVRLEGQPYLEEVQTYEICPQDHRLKNSYWKREKKNLQRKQINLRLTGDMRCLTSWFVCEVGPTNNLHGAAGASLCVRQ